MTFILHIILRFHYIMSWIIYHCLVCRYIPLPEVYDAFIRTIIIIIIIYNYHYINDISWLFRSVNFHNIFNIILWFFSQEYTPVRVSDVCVRFVSLLYLVGRIIINFSLLTSVVYGR